MTASENTARMLAELAQGWKVTLTQYDGLYYLTIEQDTYGTSRHQYRGADFNRVVHAAWGGQPGGLVT